MGTSKLLGASLSLFLSLTLIGCSGTRKEAERTVVQATVEVAKQETAKAINEVKDSTLQKVNEAQKQVVQSATGSVTKSVGSVTQTLNSQITTRTEDVQKSLTESAIQQQKDLGNIFSTTRESMDRLRQSTIQKDFKPIVYEIPQPPSAPTVTKAVLIVPAKSAPIRRVPNHDNSRIKIETPIAQGLKAEVSSDPGLKLPTLPKNAVPLIPLLRKMEDTLWPTLSMRSFLGAKIEQETCLSLTHSKCWSAHAELKTKREYGFGLGQTTVAYNANGSERFNVWKDLTRIDPVLKQKWTWDNRFDSELQMRAVVIKSKMSYDAVRFPVYNEYEHLAFGAVTYNSGSVLIDRKLCLNTPGCDGSKWFGNVERYSAKSRVAAAGYGKSFFEISREYPHNILIVRRPKYVPYLDD